MYRTPLQKNRVGKMKESKFIILLVLIIVLLIAVAFVSYNKGKSDGVKEEFRKESLNAAIKLEKLAIKIAYLRTDLSTGGLEAVIQDISDIAMKADVPLEEAEEILRYCECQLGPGTDFAKTAALSIAQFAAPAQLSPREVKKLPKLFSVMKADTKSLSE